MNNGVEVKPCMYCGCEITKGDACLSCVIRELSDFGDEWTVDWFFAEPA